MRITFGIFIIALLLATVYLGLTHSGVALWASETQRNFQNLMADAIRGLRAGDKGALLALFSAAGAYGFVHAVGPGHGKYLVGGVGLGTSIAPLRLVAVAVVSSLAQSLWAIVLVYGGFSLIAATAAQMTFLAEDVLAPASYIAIGAVGAWVFWRGLRTLPLFSRAQSAHGHDCRHAHGPAPEDVARLTNWRETLTLIGSIAVRPCTGAIFLLVIAWQIDIAFVGALAVMVMGLGTAALTTTVALSSIVARRAALFSTTPSLGGRTALSSVQMAAGFLIMSFSLTLLGLRV